MKKSLIIILLLSTLGIAKDSFGCQVAVKQFNRQSKEMKRANEIHDRQQFKASCFWAISSLKEIYVKCDTWDAEKLENIQEMLKHYESVQERLTQEDGY